MKLSKLVQLSFIIALCSASAMTFAAASSSRPTVNTGSGNKANTGIKIDRSGYKVQSFTYNCDTGEFTGSYNPNNPGSIICVPPVALSK
jgi:hypothetical protein